MITKFSFIYIVLLFLLGCASPGPVTGGVPDKYGPVLISTYPENKSIQIKSDQQIILTFNEPLDPVSIPSSIILSANYNLKIRGRKIIIEPNKIWPHNQIINIKISRRIRDYQNNIMANPIELAYSTGTNIPNGYITGNINGYSTEKIIEVGLYDWPIRDSSLFLQKVEANKNGFFKFEFIDYGTYTLAAIQGVLNNFDKQIYKNNYSMLTKDYISLSLEKPTDHVEMLLGNNLEKLEIVAVEMDGQYQANLTMNDLSKEIFIIDSLYDPGDSIKINLIKNNRLEKYVLPEYTFILPEIIDTIGPKLEQTEFNNNSLELIFSEPVTLQYNAIIIEKDSIDIPNKFELKQASTILINNLADSIYQIKLLGEYIQDWSGNMMEDSIKLVSIFQPKKEPSKIIGGNILGIIQYEGQESLAIQAHNIETDSIYDAKVNELKFRLNNLPAGIYKLLTFETLHEIDPFTYFSGIWSPYKRAANFTFYPDSVDVRARWDIEGININLK